MELRHEIDTVPSLLKCDPAKEAREADRAEARTWAPALRFPGNLHPGRARYSRLSAMTSMN